MTSEDFVRWRVDALKEFFKGKFGQRWHYKVAQMLGRQWRLDIFHYPKRLPSNLRVLYRVESLAIRNGFDPRSKWALLIPAPTPIVLGSSEPEKREAQMSTPPSTRRPSA